MQRVATLRANRLTHWAGAAWKPDRGGGMCTDLFASRLGRSVATPCGGPLDLGTNAARQNGAI